MDVRVAIASPGLGAGAVVTVSIGAWVAAAAENLNDSIERADKLLYVARKAGWNRVSA